MYPRGSAGSGDSPRGRVTTPRGIRSAHKREPGSDDNLGVGTVAEGCAACFLAGTQGDLLCFSHLKDDRSHVAARVAAIAKGMLGRMPTGAPGVFARFQFDDIGCIVD